EDGSGYRRIRVTVNSNTKLRITARHGVRLGNDAPTNAMNSQGSFMVRLQEIKARRSSFESKVQEKKNGLEEYREDFSDPASGWPQGKGAFYERKSYHVVEAEKVVANGPWFRDFEAFVTVELKKGLWQINSPDEMSIIRVPSFEKGYEG